MLRLSPRVLLTMFALVPTFTGARLSAQISTGVRDAAHPASMAITSQLGVKSDSRLSGTSTVADYHWPEPALQLGELGKADTSSGQSNRTMHIVIGVVAGVVGGVLLGKAVDKGRAGCSNEQSGGTCDWGSGLYEPLFGAVGGAIGGVVGALLPHN